MNEKVKILIVLLLGIAAGIVGYALTHNNAKFGAINAPPTYYYGASRESSSSVPTVATTTNPILSLDGLRSGATVCYSAGTSTVWLHQLSTATTTGVIVGTGIPLYPTTSAALACQNFPGFKGYLFPIAQNPASTTVSEYR